MELFDRFEQGIINAATFDHRAHLEVAWQALGRMPLEDALAWYLRHLRALVTRLGVPGKLDVTLTWAWLLLLHEHLQAAPQTDFETVHRRLGRDAVTRRFPRIHRPRAKDRLVLEALLG